MVRFGRAARIVGYSYVVVTGAFGLYALTGAVVVVPGVGCKVFRDAYLGAIGGADGGGGGDYCG